jgi:extracellular elastinolytic metalloproteinase
MRPAGLLRLAVASLLLFASGASAQDALIDLGNKAARVSRARGTGRLVAAGPSRVETLRAFLRARHDETTLGELVQTREHASGGIVHETYGQRVGGLEVYGTYARASFAANGELRSVIENLVSTARPLRPARIGPEAALRIVLQRRYPNINPDLPEESSVGNVVTFRKQAPFNETPTVTRVALPLRGNVLDVGYLVVTWDRDNVLWHTVVSGRGEIVGEQLRTNADAYRIFPNHPGVTPQALVSNPADPVASQLGWVTANTTIGNNVDAYLDRNNDNAADLNGRPVVGADQMFDFVWNGGADPTTGDNQMAAVTNLFYLNNRLHDRLYGYGFTESAGNFQNDNGVNGGVGGDPLNAEAQDGGGVNNANFATPPDGQRPRMQMYLWNATPNRDGSLDSDIVYHEYGHGLTWRMVGDMGGVTGGAVGEGMSDALAIYFNGDDRVAEYSSNNPIGIRQYPYTNYPRTYGLVVGILGPHLDGEIYAATLWRLRQLWLARGWSQDILLSYLVDGLNYTIAKPAYEDMRDGILESIENLVTTVDPAQARCTVWDAFAQFGVGVGASGQEICALGLCLFRATESFVRPPECPTGPTNMAPVPTILLPTPGTTVLVGTSVNFSGSATDDLDGDLTASMTWTSDLQGAIGAGGAFARADLVVGTHIVTASVTDSGALVGSTTVSITIEPPANTAPTVSITSPPTGTTVNLNQSVMFTGSAIDASDGDISANLVWTSSLQGAIGTGGAFARADLVVGTHVITASVTDSGALTGSATITLVVQIPNTPPAVTISSPPNGTTVLVGSSVTFTGSAIDSPDGNISANLVWTSNIQGQVGTGASFSTTALGVGAHAITAAVTDSGGLPGSAAVVVTVQPPPNTAPTVTITSPPSGSTPAHGASVTFAATATDAQDGNVSANLIWTSNSQGQIGTGPSFSFSGLTVGSHTITAAVTDSGGLPGSAAVVVTVSPPPPITLAASGYKVKGVRRVDLTWSGALTANVNVVRGISLPTTTTTANDGAYTDAIPGKGAGTFSYRVCNTGATPVCSNTVSVSF